MVFVCRQILVEILGGDDVVALLPVGEGRALDGPVIAFRTAGGKVDFGGLSP